MTRYTAFSPAVLTAGHLYLVAGPDFPHYIEKFSPNSCFGENFMYNKVIAPFYRNINLKADE